MTTTYSPERCFAPNIQQPPDFAAKIDLEMDLRNQYFGLQRGAEQRYYVPPSGSEMFFGGVGLGASTASSPPSPAFSTIHTHTRTELRNNM